jgi:hypothetical protein
MAAKAKAKSGPGLDPKKEVQSKGGTGLDPKKAVQSKNSGSGLKPPGGQ